MIRREEGFTLVELMITLTIMILAMAAASSVLIALMTQFKQQSKIAETNIEGVVGLEIMRRDIGNAGVGLPWDLNGATYVETAVSPDAQLNDTPPIVPVAVKSKPGVMMNQSDMLAVKSTMVAGSDTSMGWASIYCNNIPNAGPSRYSFSSGDRIIILTSGHLNSANNKLVVSSVDNTTWKTTYGNTTDYAPPTVGVCNQTTSDTYIIYGVDHNTDLRMPFNRADYYVKTPATGNPPIPKRCAPGTGVLYKGIIKQADGALNELELLDCVATMKVIFALDPNNDNNNFQYVTDISGMTADAIRSQLREVRVYILAQEGQKDPNYTYPNSTVTVGEFGLGLPFSMTGITDYQSYRWKQYNIIVGVKLSG
jgi:type II secretory pathway pseudopilin PulG